MLLFKIGCTWAKPKYDPMGIILTILEKGHPMMLHTKYDFSLPYGLSQDDFYFFSPIFSHFVAMATRVLDAIQFF